MGARLTGHEEAPVAAVKRSSAFVREAKTAKLLMRRIERFLDKREWQIVFVRTNGSDEFAAAHDTEKNIVGLCDRAEQIIYIDHRHDILSTLVHECLHAIEQDLSEAQVKRLEKLIMETITPRKAELLLNRLAEYFYKKSSPDR